jgi:hypothetical protein
VPSDPKGRLLTKTERRALVYPALGYHIISTVHAGRTAARCRGVSIDPVALMSLVADGLLEPKLGIEAFGSTIYGITPAGLGAYGEGRYAGNGAAGRPGPGGLR